MVDIGALIYTGTSSKKNQSSRRVISNNYGVNDSFTANQSVIEDSSVGLGQASVTELSYVTQINQKKISMEKSSKRNFVIPKNQ